MENIAEQIMEGEFFCPECGDNDFDVKVVNTGREKIIEIKCVSCDWETEE